MPNRQIADSLGINSAPSAEPVGNDGRGVCSYHTHSDVSDSLLGALAHAAALHAAENQNPLGHINRDKSGLRTVKKGCIVDYCGLRFAVQRVRQGIAYGHTLLQKRYFHAPTSAVLVVK